MAKENKSISSMLEEDHDFLLHRAMKAGHLNFTTARDCGASSNSIVAIAYNLIPLGKQEMPYDRADYDACKQMWKKLPEHRKWQDARSAMKKVREKFGTNKSKKE